MKTKLLIASFLLLNLFGACKKDSYNEVIQPVSPISTVPVDSAKPDTLLAYLVFVSGQDTVKSDVVQVTKE